MTFQIQSEWVENITELCLGLDFPPQKLDLSHCLVVRCPQSINNNLELFHQQSNVKYFLAGGPKPSIKVLHLLKFLTSRNPCLCQGGREMSLFYSAAWWVCNHTWNKHIQLPCDQCKTLLLWKRLSIAALHGTTFDSTPQYVVTLFIFCIQPLN